MPLLGTQNPTARLAALTLHNTDISTALHSRDAEVTDQHVFSQMVSLEGTPVTNQKRSGRCWLFATTNVIRTEVMRKLNVENFQLSQSYLSFYDKLEKSNFYLESVSRILFSRQGMPCRKGHVSSAHFSEVSAPRKRAD